SAPELLFLLAIVQHRAAAARPRIAGTGPVRMDHHLRGHADAPKRTRSGAARWTASLRSYSSGSFGRTSAPAGVAPQSVSLVRKKRIAAPCASTGRADRSRSDKGRRLSYPATSCRAEVMLKLPSASKHQAFSATAT